MLPTISISLHLLWTWKSQNIFSSFKLLQQYCLRNWLAKLVLRVDWEHSRHFSLTTKKYATYFNNHALQRLSFTSYSELSKGDDFSSTEVHKLYHKHSKRHFFSSIWNLGQRLFLSRSQKVLYLNILYYLYIFVCFPAISTFSV